MTQIRQTIELFAEILQENGTTHIKAETFRLAKFNETEAVEPFWKLLFELLYYCEYGKLDDICSRAFSEFSKEELVIFVKRKLQRLGFASSELANLPRDMSRGSRELLLAVGWLLCKEHIINKFMHTCTSPLDEDTDYQYDDTLDRLDDGSIVKMPDDEVGRVQQLLWFNNRIRLSLRNLYGLQREKNILRHKIYDYTRGVSTWKARNHLSTLEVYMLSHPDILKKNLELLAKDNERLQHLLKWQEQEDIFWKWMESVLDLKLQEKTIVQASCSPRDDTTLREYGHLRLQESHRHLKQAIQKYEGIVDHLELLWGEKRSEVSEKELDMLLSLLAMELSVQRANLVVNRTDSYVNNTCPPSFIYEKQPVKKSFNTKVSVPTDESSYQDGVGDIEEEILELKSIVDRLELEVEAKQTYFKHEMQNISTRFLNTICIPPLDSH